MNPAVPVNIRPGKRRCLRCLKPVDKCQAGPWPAQTPPRTCHYCCVGNRFTAHGTSADRDELALTNGGTDVLFDVLTLAGCDEAETPWEQHLVLRFADGHRLGLGDSGFDLSDLPWTANWPAERAFFLRMIDKAASGHGWQRLSYHPPGAASWLAVYRAMLAGFVPAPAAASGQPDWQAPAPADLLSRCSAHGIFQGELGCRLCDASIQPAS